MNVTRILLDLLVVLAAAKAAVELVERIGVPPVVGEIAVGVLIGPSVLHLVGVDETLRTFGELGVILLLLDVGLEMDLGELAAVGRAALTVATVGVVVPFVGGGLAASALGLGGKEAIFVGAALTATSVGITARVFGDLRALATVEARTVLGAAVADDVMGLVILTVVTRLVAQGSVSVESVVVIVLVAVGFLVASSMLGIRLAPRAFHHIAARSRSGGTVVALALAFTLAVAELANAAKLAPIVGAFVAGLALSRSPAAPRIRRELTPLGHVLVPVFFVQIGLDAQIGQFAKMKVLAIAAVLLVVAVVGKLASAGGLVGASGDRLLVGIGMIPRGEVGLIFATLGLAQGIIGRDIYAALLLVVLASTLMTPPLLTWRLRRIARSTDEQFVPADDEPVGGWLSGTRDEVELVANPPPGTALPIGLAAAARIADGEPAGERLVEWLAHLHDAPRMWTVNELDGFDELLRRNDPRAWRFLLVTGMLDHFLPELATALRHRLDDPFEADPTRTLSWPRLERLRDQRLVVNPDATMRLAALVLDACDSTPEEAHPEQLASQVASRLGLDAARTGDLVDVVRSAALLPGAARRLDALDPEPVLQLAGHLGTRDIARQAFALASASDANARTSERLSELRAEVMAVLEHPQLAGHELGAAVEQRRRAAIEQMPSAAARIQSTPASFVLARTADELAAQAGLAEPPLRRRCVRAAVYPVGPKEWRLDVAVRDEAGLLAHQLSVLAEHGLRCLAVSTVVWPDGQSLSTFRLTGARRPNEDELADAIAASLPTPVHPLVLVEGTVEFDDTASPWHTVCTVRSSHPERTMLAVTRALALAGANVVAARVAPIDGADAEILDLVDRRGRPLGAGEKHLIEQILRTGERPGRRTHRVGRAQRS